MVFMGKEWERPASLPFPKTWRRFEGLKSRRPDGRIPEFWIQDATEEMAEEITDHMVNYFSQEEELSRAIGFGDRARGSAQSREVTAQLVKQHFSLVALTDGPDGKPVLAGCNLLYVFGKDVKLPEARDDDIRKFQSVMMLTLNMVDVYRKYSVDAFTTALGLSVAPAFRGQGVGVELLKARVQLTKAVGLRLTLNNFTGVASQKQAARAGFELLAEVRYADIRDRDGSEMFPGVSTPTLQFRARYVDENTTDDDLKV